jgi:hypothetical protein
MFSSRAWEKSVRIIFSMPGRNAASGFVVNCIRAKTAQQISL